MKKSKSKAESASGSSASQPQRFKVKVIQKEPEVRRVKSIAHNEPPQQGKTLEPGEIDAAEIVATIAKAANKSQVLRLLVASLDKTDREILASSLERHSSGD